jgi:uncharacterized membrane protein
VSQKPELVPTASRSRSRGRHGRGHQGTTVDNAELRLLAATIVLGVGFAALADGVIFHQVLQWHHMLSAWHPPDTVENIKLNTEADGWFHLASYVTIVTGTVLLWASAAGLAARPPSGTVAAGLLVGFGAFNVAEGTIDHFLLGVHHVREGSHASAYDAGFLITSMLVLGLGGHRLRRQRFRQAPST